MMQKVILFAAIVVFASTASAVYWRQREPMSTKINMIEVEGCDQRRSTPDRCALHSDIFYRLHTNFIQPKRFEEPFFEVAYGPQFGSAEREARYLGLECPGQVGREQNIYMYIYFRPIGVKPWNHTLHVTLRENRTTNADILSANISLLIIMDQPSVMGELI